MKGDWSATAFVLGVVCFFIALCFVGINALEEVEEEPVVEGVTIILDITIMGEEDAEEG